MNRVRCHSLYDPRRDGLRLIEIDVWKGNQKLVGAPTCEDIVRTNRTSQDLADFSQYAIASENTIRFVDILQMINVEHDDTERLTFTLGA